MSCKITRLSCKSTASLIFEETGNKTTYYAHCLEARSTSADPASNGQGDKDFMSKLFSVPSLPPGEPGEVQYLVKWKNWSHLHNTWETEASLTSQDIRGTKKFLNFLKREEERELWERNANLEDIEYLKCQEELGDELLVNLTQVEKVIGKEGRNAEIIFY